MMKNKQFVFPEDSSFNNIDNIYKSLKKYSYENNAISFDFSKIKKIDPSFIQLICSFHKFYMNKKQSIEVTNNFSKEIIEFFQKIGLPSAITLCKLNQENCLFNF